MYPKIVEFLVLDCDRYVLVQMQEIREQLFEARYKLNLNRIHFLGTVVLILKQLYDKDGINNCMEGNNGSTKFCVI